MCTWSGHAYARYGAHEYRAVSSRSHKVDLESVQMRKHAFNEDQNDLFTKVKHSVLSGQPAIYFVDALGGCGKTYLLNCLIDDLRFEGTVLQHEFS